MTGRPAKTTVALACAALLLASCAPVPSPTPAGSSPLVWVECPPDVEAQFVSRHECGQLTVPQDHNSPAGPALTLLVLKVWPVGVEPKPGVSTSLGTNPGDRGAIGGDIAAGATRGRRISVNLMPRGTTSHGGTSLACPETDQAAGTATGDRDASVRAAFIDAIGACARRLRASGIEPALFSPAATIEDLELLRAALGEDAWAGAGTYGTMSRAALQYLSRHPGRIDRLVLDSPGSAGLDPLTAGVVGLDSALADLAADHPGLLTSWQEALATVGAQPLSGLSDGVQVTIDDAKLVRLVRAALGGDGPQHVGAVPAMIAAAARGRLDSELAALAADDPAFCAGYIPLCRGQEDFALGSFLTDFCEQLPTDRTALEAAIAGRTAYEQVFARSPYEQACALWNVPHATPLSVEPTETPTLLMSGGLDSFSRPEWSRWLADRLGPSAWSVAIPGHTHNVLGSSECAITLRDAWRDLSPAAPEVQCDQ